MRRRILGIIVIGVATVMVLKMQGYLPMEWFYDVEWKQYLLPAFLVIVGLKLLFTSSGKCYRRSELKECEIPELGATDKVSISASLGGYNYNFAGHRFCGAKVDCFMAGAKIDLRGAQVEDGSVIDIHALMGGVELRVSNDVKIMVNSNSILGGVGNHVPVCANPDAKTIIVNADCLFGGVDIKD